MNLSKDIYKSKVLGRVHYDGCWMTYRQIGNVKIITCRRWHSSWEVACSIVEDTDKIWEQIKAEARGER